MSENEKKVPKRRFKEFQNADEWEQRKWIETVDISTEMVDPRCGDYDDLPHVAPGNIESFTGQLYDNIKTVKEENLISGKFHFGENDIIYGKINPQLGKYIFATFEGLTSADAYVLNAKKNLNQKFLFTLLQTDNFFNYSVSVSKRSGIPKINRNELNAFSFLAPSIDEQEKIGSIFLKIDNLITLHQRKLDKLKALKKAYLTDMFPAEGESKPKLRFAGFNADWEKHKLGAVTERYDNLRIPVAANLRIPGTTPYYGANGIQDYVDGFTHDGEFVLVAEDGANDLKNYPVKYVKGRIWVNNHAHVLQGKDNILDTLFLSYSISQANIASLLVGGGRAKLNAEIMMGIDISLPTLEEQKRIGNYFSNLDKRIILHQRKLEKLQNIKKAYLNEMFV